ncbi:MAG: CsgG/HfaB family protein [Myxococcota bacterium]
MGAKPVVAVFALQDATATLSNTDRIQLADYLSVRLVATGRFVVLPRSQLERVLREQKEASYQDCYDEACQIEVGKELAATHSLVTQVIRVGSVCAVAATLYDLRLQATEQAASYKGGCHPEALAEAMEKLAKMLIASNAVTGGSTVASDSQASSSSRKSLARSVSTSTSTFRLALDTTPSSARVFLDGQAADRGGFVRSLARGQHRLIVERRGYTPQTLDIDLQRDREAIIDLQMEPAHRRLRTEWFGMGVGVFTNTGNASGASLSIRLFTLRWGGPFWTLLEGTIGASSGQDLSVCAAAASDGRGVCEDNAPGVMGALQTVLGWSVSLDSAHRHQLELLGGFGPFGYSAGSDGAGPLAVSPGLRYVYHGRHNFTFGVGFRSFIAVLDRDCPSFGRDDITPVTEQLACETGRQALFMVDIPFGWSN